MATTECVLIADDLTGACDAAGRFAAAGLRAVVPLRGAIPLADIVAFSTDSRDVKPADARRRLAALLPEIVRLSPRVLFKKIDSTLRGNTGHEIVAALKTFDCAAVLVNPAFPAMGRTVVCGHLLSGDASFLPIQLVPYLEAHGARRCRHVPPGAIGFALEDKIRFISMEAASNADLDEIAAELLATGARILWAGSAGLAGALAAQLGGPIAGRPPAPAHGPALFCIGSDHPVTLEQVHRLIYGAKELPSLLHIPRGDFAPGLLDRLRSTRPAALVLSGGDTASAVCRALGVETIELTGEFVPGIPIGTLRGGLYDGVAVVTKSGGFGGPDTLKEIADYFHGGSTSGNSDHDGRPGGRRSRGDSQGAGRPRGRRPRALDRRR